MLKILKLNTFLVGLSVSMFVLVSQIWGQDRQYRRPANAYVLGASDVLEITAVPEGDQTQKIQRKVIIRPDGYITFDFVGAVKAAGFTPEELDMILTRKLQSFIRGVDVTVNVTKFRAQRFFVFGEVNAPGEYPLSGQVTVLDAIALAGSYTPHASLNRVRVVRGDLKRPEIFKIKVKDIIHKGKLQTNILLQDGDVVVVPPTFGSKIGNFWNKMLYPFRDILGAAVSIAAVYVVVDQIKR